MGCTCFERAWEQQHAQLLLKPSGLSLVLLLLLLLADGAVGQGLLLRQEDLGASNKPASQKILQIYMNHLAKAKKIQRYIKTAQTSCRMKTASLCGWDVSEEDSRDVLSILASPDAYDARLPEHTGGFNLVNTPGNQDQGGSCGSCVAFAVAAAAESAVAARMGRNAASIGRLSPRYLFFCTDRTKLTACNRGMEMLEALSALIDIHKPGWPSEACLPWSQPAAATGHCSVIPGCSSSGSGSGSGGGSSLPNKGMFDYTRDYYDSVRSVAHAQRHIRRWGAVVTRFALDAADLQKFITKTADGIYQLPSGTGRGQGHAVTLIGYNNTGDGYWIVKNSFGPTWGNGGFFKVAYGSADVLDPTYTYGLTWQTADAAAAPADYLTTADAYVSKSLPGLPTSCIWYKARKGDFAERVAQNFGIPVEQLLNANFNINLLPATAAAAAGPQAKQLFGVPQDKPGAWLEGRLLKVCGARTPTAAPAAGPGPGLCITYTIKWKDTLTKISKRYNTTVDKLARDNGIRDPNFILAGSDLRICS